MEEHIKNLIKYLIDGEYETFIKVWLLIQASVCYCYLATKILPKGSFRLFSFLPVIIFFLYVPLKINSVNLCGYTGFFISWLCNFKLILLAFDQGPLSDSSLSIDNFLFLACLPIKIQQKSQEKSELAVENGYFQENQSPKPAEKVPSVQSGKDFAKIDHFHGTPSPGSVDKTGNNPFQDGHFHETPSEKSAEKVYREQIGKDFAQSGHFQETPFPSSEKSKKGQILNYVIKTLLFALIIRVYYDYSGYMHPRIIMLNNHFHIYLCLDIILAINSGLACGLYGLQFKPQFNQLYLSTSLQDFWGRRWNLSITHILRPTVYKPTLSLSMSILGRKWASLPAVMAIFIVSGLMHELMLYYLVRVKPTWEITWFFLLYGVCLSIEICVKKVTSGRFKLPRIIGTILTVGFVIITGFVKV